MVARLFRLRLALLASAFRGGFRATMRALLVAVVAIAAAVGYAWAPAWLAPGAEDRAAVDVFLASVLLASIALVPLFAHLGNLEPRQFASLPTTPAGIGAAMYLSSLLTWPTLWLLVWMAALYVLRPEWRGVAWAVAVAALLTLLLSIAYARVSSAFVKLVVPKRGLSVLRWIGALLLFTALPVIVFILTEGFRSPGSRTLADATEVLGWTPFGAPAAGLALALQGDAQGGLTRFALAAGALLLLLVIWHLLVARSVTSVERPAPDGVTRDGLELFDRFPARPRDVIAARSLTYWRRDPRYRVTLLAIPFAPVVMIVALWIAGADPGMLALLPLPVILLLLGWSVHNDVAFDSTAIWMHVASGTRGAHDRAGRLAPVMLIGLPLVVVGSSLTVTVVGDWRVLPAVMGMNLSVLLVSAGVSSVFSALMPYPATRPGDSPFHQPAVQGSGAGLAQTLSMLVALLFSIPPVLVSVGAIGDPQFETNAIALVAGAAWGLVLLWLGVLIGGKIFDRGAPELVAVTQTFD